MTKRPAASPIVGVVREDPRAVEEVLDLEWCDPEIRHDRTTPLASGVVGECLRCSVARPVPAVDDRGVAAASLEVPKSTESILTTPEYTSTIRTSAECPPTRTPLRRWMVPPFFTERATAPRTIASPPAAM